MPMTIARCEINDSILVNVSAVFTGQMRDDDLKYFRFTANEIFLYPISAMVEPLEYDREYKAAANPSPNSRIDVEGEIES